MQIMLLANEIANYHQHSVVTPIKCTQTLCQEKHIYHLSFQIIIVTHLEQVCLYRLSTLG